MDEEPWIFLSHSGVQKDFTWRLYQELVHLGYRVFFDQDAQHSLPKGQPFPPRIVKACRGCKMGIIILSHDYVESLWPMLELEQLTLHNPNNLLYPLFYQLSPADLSKPENLSRWQAKWNEKKSAWHSKVQDVQAASTSTSTNVSICIDISSWEMALQKLKYQSGSEFFPHMREHAYIREIVSNISKTIPAPRISYLLDEHVKGMEHMQQVIDDLFQQLAATQKSSTSTFGAVVVGVWGMGGLGKTTLCKHMVNFHGKEFPGRSCLLELPTEEDEKTLMEAMKEVLLTLGGVQKEDLVNFSSIEKIMAWLDEGLRNQQVFIAIDNVCDWSIGRAKQIMSKVCRAGSKVLVTGRSKGMVEKLLAAGNLSSRIVHIPSITEEEAVEALKSFSCCVLPVIAELEQDLRSLARGLCFFEEQCHPLLLKVTGAKLRHRSGGIKNEQDWKDLISRLLQGAGLNIHHEEKAVLEVLQRSLLALPLNLQQIFIDLVIYDPSTYRNYHGFCGKCKWLSMVHDGFTEMDMRDKLIELQYYGLLEIFDQSDQIRIHDLYKSVARSRRVEGRSAHFFGESLSQLSEDKCKQIKYIDSYNSGTGKVDTLRAFKHCSKLEICDITHCPLKALQLSKLQFLRYLRLSKCRDLKRIGGWKETPNLVSLELNDCGSLRNLGDMGCLKKLEKLKISGGSWRLDVPDLTHCGQLKELRFSGCDSLKQLASLGQPPKLQRLDLSSSKNLVDASTVSSFTALECLHLSWCRALEKFASQQELGLNTLEELNLQGCEKLQTIPNLENLARLRVLNTDGCTSLKAVKLGVSALASLQVLKLGGGCKTLAMAQVYRSHLSSLSARQLALELVLFVSDHLQQQAVHEAQLPCSSLMVEKYIGERGGGAGAESDTINIVGGNNIVGSQPIAPLMLHQAADDIYSRAFLNLRELEIEGTNRTINVSSLDVSGLTSLEDLRLSSFESLEEIRGVNTLAKLRWLRIYDCSLLKEISTIISSGTSIMQDGHASLENRCLTCEEVNAMGSLEYLLISYCPSLVYIAPQVVGTRLEYLRLKGCSSLRELPSLTHLTTKGLQFLERASEFFYLTNLWKIDLSNCSSLLCAPQAHRVYYYVLDDCCSLTDMSSLASISCMRSLSLKNCSSLIEIPNLTHLTDLEEIELGGCSSLVCAPKVCMTTKILYYGKEKMGYKIKKASKMTVIFFSVLIAMGLVWKQQR